jgi:Carboxypeptidase regulatory-like domain
MKKVFLPGIIVAAAFLVNLQSAAAQNLVRGENTRNTKSGLRSGASYSNDISAPLADLARLPAREKTESAPAPVTGIKVSEMKCADCSLGDENAPQRLVVAIGGYEITDKASGAKLAVSNDPSTIWRGMGGACETGGAGNLVAVYDKFAGRWMISQFAAQVAGGPVNEECFAVSASGDAAGAYNRYAFHLGGNFIDSPHIDARADGLYMGDSVYNDAGDTRLGSRLFVFDRTAMAAGTAASFRSEGLVTASVPAKKSVSDSPSVAGMTINLTYDPDSTFTAAGLTAADITNMKAANTFVISVLKNYFTDPINVNIKVTATPGTTTLGQSTTSLSLFTYSAIRTRFVADSVSADDTTVRGAGGSMPTTDPITASHNYIATFAQAKALGLSADNAVTVDGTFTFGGGQPYTYASGSRAVAGKYDYIGVALHEFTEIMGRIGLMGEDLGAGSPSYMIMDLFHFTAANTRGLSSGPGRSFSVNNGTNLLKSFNGIAGGDLQDWASGSNDAFNAFSSSGIKNDLTAVDVRVMDAIGYNLSPTSANVSVSGRVLSPTGLGVRGAVVTMTGPNGIERRAVTGSFGYYSFDDVAVGDTYLMTASSKQYQFAPRVLSVPDELANVDLIGQ